MRNNYQELLKTKEWKRKRREILKRDSFTCVNCLNKNLFTGAEKFKYFGYAPTNNSNVIKLGVEKNTYESICYIGKTYFINYIKDQDNISLLINPSLDLKQKSIISIIETTTEKVIFAFGLHVHHSYYQEEKNPWEYPGSSLTTLCWLCHEILHKNQKIPFYDRNGFQIGDLSPCLRCHGAGWFPEYNHIEGGVCFRCNGARFEEHIKER